MIMCIHASTYSYTGETIFNSMTEYINSFYTQTASIYIFVLKLSHMPTNKKYHHQANVFTETLSVYYYPAGLHSP